MSHSILITGASGYLGGTLLARLRRDELPSHKAIYALVRTKEQEDAVKTYGVEPLYLDLSNESAVCETITKNTITIVFFLIDAFKHDSQIRFIKALAEVKKQTGLEVHFLHTSGAKLFSEHAGMRIDAPFADNDPRMYEQQKSSKAPPQLEVMNYARGTNNIIVETAEAYGVKCYIFIPCIVYGEGEGFGNRISIQTVAIVKAAKALRRVYDVNPEHAVWPVCHVLDNSALYQELLISILSEDDVGSGKSGYYLASSGSVAWRDLYTAMASSLAKHGAVDDEKVEIAEDTVLTKMGEALDCPKEMVRLQLGGCCMLTAENGKTVGWKPQFSPQHILDAADAEVQLILANL